MILYRVRDWDKHFENNRTRLLAKLTWVPVPNKMDGDGYTALVSHRNAAAHLGAWLAIVEVASKCHPRGTLVRDDGTPMRPSDMSRLTRLPARIFEEVLPRLASRELRWLETSEVPDETTEPLADGGVAHPSAGEAHSPAPSRAREKGMEWNGMELNNSLPARARRNGFEPPTPDQVLAWVKEKHPDYLPTLNPTKFCAYYESKGWKVGKDPMTNWKAAVVGWVERERERRG